MAYTHTHTDTLTDACTHFLQACRKSYIHRYSENERERKRDRGN